jgi:hypothetical protein
MGSGVVATRDLVRAEPIPCRGSLGTIRGEHGVGDRTTGPRASDVPGDPLVRRCRCLKRPCDPRAGPDGVGSLPALPRGDREQMAIPRWRLSVRFLDLRGRTDAWPREPFPDVPRPARRVPIRAIREGAASPPLVHLALRVSPRRGVLDLHRGIRDDVLFSGQSRWRVC